METVILVTGGFDPVHSGHIAYFKAAKQLGSKLVVGVNSDDWLIRKKGQAFMPWTERAEIVRNITGVDDVIAFDDTDDSARDACIKVKNSHKSCAIIFANGGDRTSTNIPEMDVAGIAFAFGVGGENKKNSSSWILQDWKSAKTERDWGHYRVLHDVTGLKVKELTVDPGKSLSMQRHEHRSEFWIVSEGACLVHSQLPGGYSLPSQKLCMHDDYKIPVGEWHQLTNPYDVPCRIVEIQHGTRCSETDIERKEIQKETQ